jgi:hypothetical protein
LGCPATFSYGVPSEPQPLQGRVAAEAHGQQTGSLNREGRETEAVKKRQAPDVWK